MVKSPFRPFGSQPPPPMQVPKVALDRRGLIIEEGHLLAYSSYIPLIFEVAAVHPVVNPNAQGGMAMQITLRAEFNIQSFAGVPGQQVMICGESEARLAANAAAGKENGKAAIGSGALGAGDPGNSEPTDPHPVDADLVVASFRVKCDQCGEEGTVRPTDHPGLGDKCTDCGVGVYQKVE